MADGHVAEPAGSVRWQALQLSAGCPSVRSRHPAVQHVWPGQARSHSLAQVCDFIFSQTGGVTEVPVPLESDACHFIQDGPAGRGRWAPVQAVPEAACSPQATAEWTSCPSLTICVCDRAVAAESPSASKAGGGLLALPASEYGTSEVEPSVSTKSPLSGV